MTTQYWNYSDAWAYALALNQPESGERMTADSSRWHQALYELRDKYRDRVPGAFKDVFFDLRTGKSPFSSQVDHFLHVQAQARLMSAPNPAYVVLEMSSSQKATIIKLNQDRLAAFKEPLALLGKDLAEKLRYEG